MADMTLVTCLFDLAPYDTDLRLPSERQRPIAGSHGYLRLASQLLRHNQVPFVIFADKQLLPRLHAIRPPGPLTRYVSADLADLPIFARAYPRLVELYRAEYHRRLNPIKDTPAYVALMNSKWWMLDEVARSSPFATPFLGWIDLGLAHVAPASDLELVPLLVARGAGLPLSLCVGSPRGNASPPPRAEITRRFWAVAAGGLWTMPTSHAPIWAEKCTTYWLERTEAGDYPLDGELLYRLLMRMGRVDGERDPDVTDAEAAALPPATIYHADYHQLISRHPAIAARRSAQAS